MQKKSLEITCYVAGAGAFGVFLRWLQDQLAFDENGLSEKSVFNFLVPLLLIAAVCLLASMNDMAAPSVSLEGKSLWLAQSLPVKPWQVLRAKLAVHLTLTGVPAAVCYVLLAFAHPFSAAELLLGAVLWETGIRRIFRWIGKRLKKSFPTGRNMQNHSE